MSMSFVDSQRLLRRISCRRIGPSRKALRRIERMCAYAPPAKYATRAAHPHTLSVNLPPGGDKQRPWNLQTPAPGLMEPHELKELVNSRLSILGEPTRAKHLSPSGTCHSGQTPGAPSCPPIAPGRSHGASRGRERHFPPPGTRLLTATTTPPDSERLNRPGVVVWS